MKNKKSKNTDNTIARNKRASHEYHLENALKRALNYKVGK